MQPPKSNAEASLAICSLFESELLLGLMMRQWNHPRAEDEDFQSQLLETATRVLETAATSDSHVFIEGVPPSGMNLVSAIWYAENRAIEEDCASQATEDLDARVQWLKSIERALPSCFCDPREFI